jgi:hypothetical protein
VTCIAGAVCVSDWAMTNVVVPAVVSVIVSVTLCILMRPRF